MKTRITKTSADQLEAVQRDSYLWDDKTTGFGLKVTPKGRKVFIVQYRQGGRAGRTRRVTIGPFKAPGMTGRCLTVDQARKQAEKILGALAQGEDPAEKKSIERKKGRFGDHLAEWFEREVQASKKPTTIDSYERVIRLYVPKRLKARKTDSISKQDIRALRDGMKTNLYGANKTLAVLSAFFNWCEGEDIRPNNSNPCKGVSKYKEKSHKRFLSPDEQIKLAEALSASEGSRFYNPYAVAAIRLLAFTGARKSEILTLQWAWVDFENKRLNLPDSKTGEKSIYLNAPALEVLSNLPRLQGNPYVIVGSKEGQRLVNIQKPWSRIRNEAGMPDLRLHDLRHTFASIAVMGGMSLPMVGALLGHKHARTTQRYAHLAGNPMIAAAESVGSKLISRESKLKQTYSHIK